VGAFCTVSLRGVSVSRVSVMVLGCMGYDVCADDLENIRWQNGHSLEASNLIDVTTTSIAMEYRS
jgi:hypothetical protein